jgi:hypothetical protein
VAPSYLCPPPSPKCSLRSTLTSPSHKMCRNPRLGVFPTSFLHNLAHIYIYLDGRFPPRPPLNFQSQITGNLAVYGFAFSPFFLTPSPLVPGYILSLTFVGAHARLFLIVFQGRRNCDFSTTAGVNSCLDGGCNGGLKCDPHTGTVRLSPTIFTHTQLTPTLCLPFPSPLLPMGAAQGVPPATVAEWTLQGDGNKDFYDGARVTFLLIPPSSENFRTE